MGTGITQLDPSGKKAYERKNKVVDLEHLVDEHSGRFEKIIALMRRAFQYRGRRLRHGVQKRVMEYSSRRRDLYRAIISYDDASGYAIKPRGTIITALSDYRL